MSAIRLIVGLGNPGREYEATRHNAGFWWVDSLAASKGATLSSEKKFHGLAARLTFSGREVWLLEPQTFMNRSGQGVAALAHFYKIAPEEILVVHDELDLPPGTVRLKQGGGHGGHNGLKDIVTHLGTPNFWRLRLGIGHPGNREEVVNYVLNPPRREEQEEIEAAMGKGLVRPAAIAGGGFRRRHAEAAHQIALNGKSSPVILFGAFDRHNLGDLLFPHIVAKLRGHARCRGAGTDGGRHPPCAAGVAGRHEGEFGACAACLPAGIRGVAGSAGVSLWWREGRRVTISFFATHCRHLQNASAIRPFHWRTCAAALTQGI